uniref:Pantoate--beta-alanine ligase n=1 Tax=Anthurium amnicola TaxID=1678845 RepID=A0A1D1XZZ9_9ARAE
MAAERRNTALAVAVIRDKDEMRSWSRSHRAAGSTVALVPTMGYLHHGHLSLVEEAKRRAQLTVVSIYVNPGQFAPTEDLSTYPSDLQGDLRTLAQIGVDAVFCPANLYDYGDGGGGGVGGCGSRPGSSGDVEGDGKPGACVAAGGEGIGKEAKLVSCLEERGGHDTWIRVERLEKGLCGKSRPVFFRGVATVVAKLFNIVEPDFAVFGKKDYQQWRIIRRMVRDLDFAVNVIGSDIVRDADGLAMSSRNVHLSPVEREKALSINRSLSKAKVAAENGEKSCNELKSLVIQSITEAGGRVDYAEIVDQESLVMVELINRPVVLCVAAWFGKVRLIDNIEISL